MIVVKLGSHVAVLDLKDVFYSVTIALEHRKYLRFKFIGELYQINALPKWFGMCT